MSPTTVTVDVDRPADEVFAYAIDPTHFHEWQNGVVAGRMDRGGMPELGDHCVTTRRIGGAERPSTSEIVRVDPPRAWSVRGIDGPIRASVDLIVKPLTGTQSRLTISVDFQGHGIGKVGVSRPALQRRLEHGELPTPAGRNGRGWPYWRAGDIEQRIAEMSLGRFRICGAYLKRLDWHMIRRHQQPRQRRSLPGRG